MRFDRILLLLIALMMAVGVVSSLMTAQMVIENQRLIIRNHPKSAQDWGQP